MQDGSFLPKDRLHKTSYTPVELKSGSADYRVFGQISMYIGLLTAEFPERKISGVIVAGAIDAGLKSACGTTDRVALKVYRMSVELDDA